MLKHLHIKNFAIIQELELDFDSGLTVLTGETGAGKSILIDALQIILGEKTDPSIIYSNADRCEMTAIFDLSQIAPAMQWLQNQEDEIETECFIRRIVSRDGRSRCTINGRPVTLSEIRDLSGLLLQIHGQNQHTLLLKNDYQRNLLDQIAKHETLCKEIRGLYNQWKELKNALEACQQNERNNSHAIEKDLLSFQIQELENFGPVENELQNLTLEHKQLANAEQSIKLCQQTLQLLTEDEHGNSLNFLYSAIQLLKNSNADGVNRAINFFEEASIQLTEGVSEIENYLNQIEINPERLLIVEERMAQLHQLARKHKIAPEELPQYLHTLNERLSQLQSMDGQIQELEHKIKELEQCYFEKAQQLTQQRQQAAKKFSALISEQMQELGMPSGEFLIQLNPETKSQVLPHGNDKIEFLVTTNKGQALQPLNKVASGGEISRISLAIQVLMGQGMAAPTIIFDEVDVGIGGRVAEMVGQKLKLLGNSHQVLCVTHQPQVAAKSHNHLLVQKNSDKNSVQTNVKPLNDDGKIQEIARMLGGIKITDTTVAHAKELLELV